MMMFDDSNDDDYNTCSKLMYVQLDGGVCVPVGLCLSASSKGAPSIHPSIHPIQSNPKPDHRAHRHCIFVIILIQVGGVCGWACADLLATLDRFLQFHRFLLLCSSFSWILLLDPPPGSSSWILLLDPSPPIPPAGQFLPFSSTG